MLQNLYRFNVYIFMFTNEIRPYKAMQTIANRRAIRTLSRRWVSSMLKPEDFMARNAVSISQRFIGRYSIFRSVETDQDLKFGYPFRVFDSTSGKIDILPFMQKSL